MVQGQMECKIFPSAFSGEVVFQVAVVILSNGGKVTWVEYEGVCPKHNISYLSKTPTKDGADGQIKVHLLSSNGKKARVRLPDFQVVTVSLDKVTVTDVQMVNDLEKYVGVKIERIHKTPDGRGGFKSISLCFKDGKCLRFEPIYTCSEKGLVPAVKMIDGTWGLVEAESKPMGEWEKYRQRCCSTCATDTYIEMCKVCLSMKQRRIGWREALKMLKKAISSGYSLEGLDRLIKEELG